MADIGIGQGAVLSKAEEIALNLTSDQKRNVELIQAALDEAAGKVKEAATEEVVTIQEAPPAVVEEVAQAVEAVEASPVEPEEEEPHRKRRR